MSEAEPAEAVAMRRVVELAGRGRGGTLVVTLEPCNHTGRTGPRVAAIRAAGIRRVVYAVADPNPPAAGGAEALRAAGVEVDGGLLADAAERVNVAWLTYVRLRRPHVTWKFAASAGGQGRGALGAAGVTTLARAYHLDLEDVTAIGPDLWITARQVPPPKES